MREEHYDLEQYESERGMRRSEEELVLDWMLRKRILRCYAGVTEEEIYDQCAEGSRIRRHREQTRQRASFGSSIRHAMAKMTGGILGSKRIKDRRVHLLRLQTQKNANLVTSTC